MDEIVPKFRRAIGDNETPYSYADTILAEYIADSLESIQINYSHDYVVDRDTLQIEPEVNVVDQFLFIINAQIEMLNRRSNVCLLYTSPSPRDRQKSRMPSSA